MDPRLRAYLNRVGFAGEPRADLDTLTRIQRGHMLNIAYENIDVQLGRPLGFDIDAQLQKIAGGRRGGWCYEMNGVYGWALEQIGFKVTRLAGAVARAILGDAQIGNHLVLRVDLAQPYIADVGFGDCPLAPVPLRQHKLRHGFLEMELQELGDGWWRLHSHARGSVPSFDVSMDPARTSALAPSCTYLQQDPASPFVQNLVCMRHTEDSLLQLRGKLLRTLRAGATEQRELASARELAEALDHQFGLGVSEADVDALWQRVEARHREVMRAKG